MQSLWDPGQQVIPQRVINRNAEIPGTRQEGGLGATATHTQHIGDTQRGQLVLHTHTHTRFVSAVQEFTVKLGCLCSTSHINCDRLCVHINVGNCLEHF